MRPDVRRPGGGVVRGVVFDLDGTLVDSWSLHLAALRQAVTATRGTAPSAAGLAASQRATDFATVEALVGPAHAVDAWSVYRQALRDRLRTEGVSAMPQAVAAVRALRHARLSVGVCTGRSRAEAELLLDAAGIEIDLTVAREDAARPKPAADGLLRALETLGLLPLDALYVGDTPSDAEQGRAAGVTTFLVGAGPAASEGQALVTDLGQFVACLGLETG